MPAHPHRPSSASAADGRDPTLTRAEIAWEWLRRDPEYLQLAPCPVRQTAYGSLVEHAPSWCEARWGCLNVSGANAGSTASTLWSASVMAGVLRAEAHPAHGGQESAFDLRRWAPRATLVPKADGCEHLLLQGYGRAVRIDIVAGSVCDGPVDLRYGFDGPGDHEPAIATLRRLLLICRTGEITAIPPDQPAPRRSIEALRVHDALVLGASIRDIGAMIFGTERVRSEWLAPNEALKSHCRRLIAYARFMAAGGFMTLLR